ncbi:MAG: RNA pseudouridine synthase [Pseudomonadota bacterium]
MYSPTTKKDFKIDALCEKSFFEEFSRNILYEDNHLLGVYKPHGLLVQGDHTNRSTLFDMAKHWLKLKHQKPGNVFLGLVHRLDRPVAGVVLFAKTSKGASRISAQFREHTIVKIYHAVVYGKPSHTEGDLQVWLVQQEKKMIFANKDTPGAQHARLFYKTLGDMAGRSLIEVRLITGRRHQIRAQLSALGHPIVGDRLYGSDIDLGPDNILLMAKSISFRHPTRLVDIFIESPYPPDWPWPDGGTTPRHP